MANEVEKKDRFPVIVKVNDGINLFHSHRETEIICILKGTAQATVNGQCHQLSEEDLCIINSENLHAIEGGEELVYLSLIIDAEYFNRYIPNISTVYYDCIPNPQLGGEDDNYLQELKGIYGEIIRAYITHNATVPDIVISKTIELFAQLRDWFTLIKFNLGEIRSNDHFERIWDIIDYIYDNCWRRLPLAEVAQFIHLSPSYLSHTIKKVTGSTYEELVNIIRSENALKLLIETDMSLMQISADCGFSDPKYFSMYFKRFYGISPREYRAQNVKIHTEGIHYNKNLNDLAGWSSYISERLERFSDFQPDSKGSSEGLNQKRYDIDAAGKTEKAYEKTYKILHIKEPEDLLTKKSRPLIKEAKELAGFGTLSIEGERGLTDKLKIVIEEIAQETGMQVDFCRRMDHGLKFSLYGDEHIGLFSDGGIRRKAFYLHYLMDLLQGQVLHEDNNCIATRKGACIYILLQNSPFSQNKKEGQPVEIKTYLTDLAPGEYRILEYMVENEWIQFESETELEAIQTTLSPKEMCALKTCFSPTIKSSRVSIKGNYRMKHLLDMGAAVLILMKKAE